MGHTPDTPEHDIDPTLRDEALQSMWNAVTASLQQLTLVRKQSYLPYTIQNDVAKVREQLRNIGDACYYAAGDV